jgi:hypothetical protein
MFQEALEWIGPLEKVGLFTNLKGSMHSAWAQAADNNFKA